MPHLKDCRVKRKKVIAKKNNYDGQVWPVGYKFDVNSQNLFKTPNED